MLNFCLGAPIEVIQAASNYKFGDINTCIYLHQTKLGALYLAKLTIVHFITALCIHRYLIIKNVRLRHVRRTIGIILSYLLFIFIPISYQLVTHKSHVETMCLTSRNLPPKCKENCFARFRPVLGIMAFSIVTCNFITGLMVILQRRFIKKHDKVALKQLGHTKITNLTRVNATMLIWVCFSIAWLPYPIQIRNMVDKFTLYLVKIILRSISYTSFLTLPFVYIIMDKNFADYIKFSILSRKRINPGVGNTCN